MRSPRERPEAPSEGMVVRRAGKAMEVEDYWYLIVSVDGSHMRRAQMQADEWVFGSAARQKAVRRRLGVLKLHSVRHALADHERKERVREDGSHWKPLFAYTYAAVPPSLRDKAPNPGGVRVYAMEQTHGGKT